MSHKLEMYENLRKMLECEVEKIEKKGALDDVSLNNLHKLMSTMDHVDMCISYEQNNPEEDGASHKYPRYSNRGGNRIYIDGDGVREAMRYFPRGENDDYGYSRDEAKKKMIRKLETLVDDYERDVVGH